jgi:GTP cyclohydrolase-4
MLPDVQTRAPDIKISLTRVGVSGVRKLLRIPRNGERPIVLLADFSCFVDLPSSQKGTHMSRNLEAINEIIEEIVDKPVYELESLCEDMVKEVLKRHNYASMCDVEMESRLMMMRRTPSGKKEQEFIKLIARSTAYKNKKPSIEREIGAEVRGLLLHPHVKGGPSPGCGQTAEASLVIQVPEGQQVKIDDIVDILEAAMSSKAYAFLPEDEEKLALDSACISPKSAGDVVDDILKEAERRFAHLSGMKATAKCIAKDSLFTYDSYAEDQTVIS